MGFRWHGRWSLRLSGDGINPVTRDDFQSARSGGLGVSRRVCWRIFIVGFLISFIGSLSNGGTRPFVGGSPSSSLQVAQA